MAKKVTEVKPAPKSRAPAKAATKPATKAAPASGKPATPTTVTVKHLAAGLVERNEIGKKQADMGAHRRPGYHRSEGSPGAHGPKPGDGCRDPDQGKQEDRVPRRQGAEGRDLTLAGRAPYGACPCYPGLTAWRRWSAYAAPPGRSEPAAARPAHAGVAALGGEVGRSGDLADLPGRASPIIHQHRLAAADIATAWLFGQHVASAGGEAKHAGQGDGTKYHERVPRRSGATQVAARRCAPQAAGSPR